MISSLLVYGITFVIPVCLSFFLDNNLTKNKKISFFYLIIIALIPSLVASFRYGIGTDYFAYISRYNTINSIGFVPSLSEYGEPLYLLINIISKLLFNSPQAVFFISQFIATIFILLGASNFRKSNSMSMILLIYLLYYYIEGFNIVRQTIAMSIIFYSFKYLFNDRNFKRYLFWIVIAFLFHKTSIISIFFYFLPNKLPESRKEKIWVSIFFVVCLIATLLPEYIIEIGLNLPVISDYLSRYVTITASMPLWHSVLRIAPFVLTTFLFSRRLIYYNKNYFILITWGILTMALIIPLSMISYTWRIEYYLVLPQLLTGSSVLQIFNRKENKLLGQTFIIFLYLFFFYFYYVFIGYGPGIPYETIFLF